MIKTFWKVVAFKAFQVIGMGATISFAIGLTFGWLYEPRLWLRVFEIIMSVTAALGLAIDFLDLSPGED